MAARTVVKLPATMNAWRDVLTQAVGLPYKSIRVPPQFSIVHGSTGEFLWSFGPAPTVRAAEDPNKAAGGLPAVDARTSGVLVILVPAPTEPEILASKTGLAELAQRISGPADRHGPREFSLHGQPSQRGRAADEPAIQFDGLDLLVPMTMRTGNLRAHGGQMSFPGGRCDGDETPFETAVREAHEEIGLDPSTAQFVGETSRLYSFPSRTYVHPCVAVCGDFVDSVRVASVEEVESIHFLSFGALLSDSRFHHRIEKSWSTTGPMRMPCFYSTDGRLVWGLTAFALCELLARVMTILDIMPTVPNPVLKEWGDSRLAAVKHVDFINPYAEAARQPARDTRHTRELGERTSSSSSGGSNSGETSTYSGSKL